MGYLENFSYFWIISLQNIKRYERMSHKKEKNMTEDEIMKRLIEILPELSKIDPKEKISDKHHKILASSIYQLMLDKLNTEMIQMFGKEICDEVFKKQGDDVHNDEENDPPNPEALSEFVSHLFETFDKNEVLIEIIRQGYYAFPLGTFSLNVLRNR